MNEKSMDLEVQEQFSSTAVQPELITYSSCMAACNRAAQFLASKVEVEHTDDDG